MTSPNAAPVSKQHASSPIFVRSRYTKAFELVTLTKTIGDCFAGVRSDITWTVNGPTGAHSITTPRDDRAAELRADAHFFGYLKNCDRRCENESLGECEHLEAVRAYRVTLTDGSSYLANFCPACAHAEQFAAVSVVAEG